LSAAYALTPGPPKRLLKQLAIAVGNLRSVANSVELIAGIDRAEELLAQLRELTDIISTELASGSSEHSIT
jgi:hypothetical protein